MRTPCSTRHSACRRARSPRGRAPRASRRAPPAGPRTRPAGSSRGLGSELVAPVWVEPAQAPDPLLDLRMRDEERRETLFEERVERPEGLGRRARLEVDELGRLLESEERVREPVRRPAELSCTAIRLDLAL